MIETPSDLLWSSSASFNNLRKMFENVRLTFGTVVENLREPSESRRKSSENRQKRRHLHVYVIKTTLHVSPEKGILYSCGKNYISLVRCSQL